MGQRDWQLRAFSPREHFIMNIRKILAERFFFRRFGKEFIKISRQFKKSWTTIVFVHGRVLSTDDKFSSTFVPIENFSTIFGFLPYRGRIGGKS